MIAHPARSSRETDHREPACTDMAFRVTARQLGAESRIHTPGGLVLAAGQIAHALKRHRAKVTVFVPHYAMSGGTLVALAADEIVMDPNAGLGPVDPQIGQWPAASVLAVLERKKREDIDDDTLILADVSRKAIVQLARTVQQLRPSACRRSRRPRSPRSSRPARGRRWVLPRRQLRWRRRSTT